MTDQLPVDDVLSAAGVPTDRQSRRESAPDLTDAVAELARIDLRTSDLSQTLHRIAELAQKTLPGADEVSVSLFKGIADHGTTTAAFTGQLAVNADELQYAGRQGPCIAAGEGGHVMLVNDMANEDRWPEYAARAVAVGVGSSLSVPLPIQDVVTGALNIYSTRPAAFDQETVDAGRVFAGYAAVAIANSHLYETTATLARQMQEAMGSRAVIEQAKGLVMGQRRCSADEAFELLVRASSRSNRKLRDVAADLIASAQRRS